MSINEYDELLKGLAPARPDIFKPTRVQQNPYDAVLRQAEDDRLRAGTEVLRQAETVNPDARAEAIQLSGETQQPVDLVERNLDAFRRQARGRGTMAEQVLRNSPKLTEWIAEKPWEAAAAADDLEWLSKQELNLGFAGALLRGIDSVQSMFGRSLQWAGGWSGLEGVRRYGRDVAEHNDYQRATLGKKTLFWDDVDSPAAFGQFIIEAIGEQIPIMGTISAGAAAGTLLAPVAGVSATIGSILGAALPSFTLGTGETQGQLVEEAGDPDAQAGWHVFVGGSAVAALDSVLPVKLGGRLVRAFGKETAEQVARRLLAQPVAPKFLRDIGVSGAKSMATEGITEALQEALTATFASAGAGTVFDVNEAWRAMREAAVTGAVVGGAADVSVEAATFQRRRAQWAAAEQQRHFFEALGTNAENSKLRERLPEAYQSALAHMTKDGPLENLYVDTETFEKYFQSKEVSPDVMAAELTGDPEALAKAKAAGTPLTIPTAVYAARVAATEHHAAFAPELRLRPDAMNAREAQEQQAERLQKLQEMTEAIRAGAAAQPAGEPVLSPLAQAITAMAMEDPGFVAMTQQQAADALSVAQAYAVGVEAVVTNLATKAGQNPFDVLAQYGFTIGPQGTQAAIDAVRTQQAAQEAAGEAQAEGDTEGVAEGDALPTAAVAAEDDPLVAAAETLADPDEGAVPLVEPEERDAEGNVVLEQTDEGKPKKPSTQQKIPIPATPEMAAAPAVVEDGRLRISTRVPTSVTRVAATEGPLRTDLDAIRGTKLLPKLVDAMRRYVPMKLAKNPERAAEQIVQLLTDNLRWLWNAYPEAWRERARHWYVGAHRIAQDLARTHNISLEQASGVLAVLSPQKDWYQNVALAEQVLEHTAKLSSKNAAFSPRMAELYIDRAYAAIEAVVKEITTRSGPDAAARYRSLKRRQALRRVKAFQGKRWSDLPLFAQAVMVRMSAELGKVRGYHIITPEGERGDLARTADGKPATLAWQTYDAIAKAVVLTRDGDGQTIHEMVGAMHKVRSFFNNINDPWSADSVTVDTHAGAAAFLKPLGGKSPEILDAMGKAGGDAALGIKGTNPILAEAYFRLAAELGVLPREVQSVTWEAGRSLFPTSIKKAGTDATAAIEGLWQQFRTGKLTLEAVHERLLDAAGGFRPPGWRNRTSGVALDESSLRGAATGRGAGDLSAGRGDPGSGAGLVAGGLARLPDGPVVSRPAVIAQVRKAGAVDRTAVTRTLDRFRDAATRVYEAEGDRTAPEVRGLKGTRFAPHGEFAAAMAAAGYPAPVLLEHDATKENATSFRQRIVRSKEASAEGPAVFVYSAAQYQKMRLFLTEDGRSGFALKPDGDIVSVFSSGGGLAHAMLALAVQEGGTKLDAFDTVLPDIYAVNGFREVRREAWNDEYAPEGWWDDVTKRETPLEAQARATAAARARRGVRTDATTAARRPPRSEDVAAAAVRYAAQHGFQLADDEYVAVDPVVAVAIADVYDELKVDDSKNPRVRKAYEAFAREVQQQWDFLIAEGFQLTPWTSEGQPYQNATEMTTDVIENKRLFFFTGGEDHPFIGEKTRDASGLTINDKFRAVHDVFGHAAGGFGFGERGEENAWRTHSHMFSAQARRAMTTETRGQNSWVNFGFQNYDAQGKWRGIPPPQRPYAAQKVALLPDRFVFPEGRSAFADYNNGRPDVVYMEFDPKALKTGGQTFYQTKVTPNTTTTEWATSRLIVAVEQAKAQKATGRDWKAIIKGSKAGINAEEYLLAHVDDLADGTQYTRQEVIDYLRVNQIQITTVTMTTAGPNQSVIDEAVDKRITEELNEKMEAWQEGYWVDDVDIDAEIEEVVDDEGKTWWQVGRDEDDRWDTIEEAEDEQQKRRDWQYEEDEHGARQALVREIDREWIEAAVAEELQEEWRDSPKGAKFDEYQLDADAAMDGSYREVFLTAASEQRRGYQGLTVEENEIASGVGGNDHGVWKTVNHRIAEIERDLATLIDPETGMVADQDSAFLRSERRARVRGVLAQWVENWNTLVGKRSGDERARVLRWIEIAEKIKALDNPLRMEQAWEDGHAEYGHIDNPIVRLRLTRFVGRQQVETAQVVASPEEVGAETTPLGRPAFGRTTRWAVHPEGAAPSSGAWTFFETEAEARAAVAAQPTRAHDRVQHVLFVEELQPPSKDESTKIPELYRKVWRDLGLKWALRHAAEMGLDGVAWTTGQQQSDRYSLERVIRSMHWAPDERPASEAGGRAVTLVTRYGGNLDVFTDANGQVTGADAGLADAVGRPLSDVIGADLAGRVMTFASGETGADDLTVGGEGLKRLYDKDIPTALSKLPVVKKHGGRLARVHIDRSSQRTPTSEQPYLALTPGMRAALLAGQQTLFQGEQQGSITLGPGIARIQFTQSADLSTFLHETGHLYLHILGDLVQGLAQGDPQAWTAGQKSLVEDFQKILKWLGVTDRSQIGVAQHEQFARGFEAYLMRGKAPSATLRGVFARYRSWLVSLYKSMVALRVDLSEEIVEVFDRMVASDAAIEQARTEAAMHPVFATAEQAGMSAIEWRGYQTLLAAAHEAAKDQLAQKILGELRRARAEWWKEKTAEVRQQVTEQLRNQPVYRALLWLQRGEMPDGTKADDAVRLSKASIVDRYGDARLKTLPLPWTYQVEGGIDVEVAAELFGFGSGDHLLTALAQAEKIDDVIARETTARMDAEFGNMRIDGTLYEAAQVAVEENGYEYVLAAELRALTKMARAMRPIRAAANRQAAAEEASARRAMREALAAETESVEQLRADADATLATLPVRNLNPQMYWQAARKAATAAAAAVEDGRYEDAVRLKRQQRLAVALHKAAQRAVDAANRTAKYAERLARPAAQARLGKAGQSYQDQVNAILEKFQFARVSDKALDRRQHLREWVEARIDEGLPVALPADLMEALGRTHYRELTVERLRDVFETLKQIEHLARTKTRLLTSRDRRTFERQRDELVERIAASHAPRPKTLEFRRKDQRWHAVREFFASHARLATLAYWLDGNVEGGPAWQLLVRPLNEAADAKAARRMQTGEAYRAVIAQHYPGRQLGTWNTMLHIPAINKSLSKEARLAVALNWGNASSRDRLLGDPSRGWSQFQVQAILDTLDQRDWQFVQATWDFLDTFWQEISDKHFRLTGLRPTKVEPMSVTTKFGTFRGGYYPLAYDSRLSDQPKMHAEITDAKQLLSGAYMQQTTKRGHEQQRKEHVELPVRLEVGVMFAHLDQVIHDLTHHEPLIDVSRLLRDRKVAAALMAVGGEEVLDQFRSAITDIATDLRAGKNQIDRAATWAKTGAQIAALGWNLWTAVQQPIGLTNGMQEVGVGWVLKGLARWMRDASTMENTLTWIQERSSFMAARHLTQNQDINDLRNRLAEPGGWFDDLVRKVSSHALTQGAITDAFLWHIGLAQRVADVPTWLGAFEKHMAGGKSEADAVALADQAVRDSQGGGSVVDLSQVQRGGPVARLFMVFYTYGATVYNQTAKAYGRTQFTKPAQVARFLGDLSLLYILPAVITVALKRLVGTGEEDDDDKTAAQWMAEVGRESISIGLNSIVLVRELSGLLNASNRGYGGPAGTRVIQNIYSAAAQITQGEADEGLWKSLNALAGVIFRYPAAQVQRTVDGFVALAEGETGDPRALLYGPPRQ